MRAARMLGRLVIWTGLLGLCALIAVTTVVPRLAGATTYTVLTGSMRPHYPPGTLVVVRPVQPDQISIGDVVTYQIRSGERAVITHRVVAISQGDDGPRFTLQGDANSAPDELAVRPVQVRGELWYSVPYVGRVTNLVPDRARQWAIYAAAGGLVAYAVVMFGQAFAERTRRRHSVRGARHAH